MSATRCRYRTQPDGRPGLVGITDIDADPCLRSFINGQLAAQASQALLDRIGP